MGTRFDAAVLAAITLVTVGTILGTTTVVVAAAVPLVYLFADSLSSAPSASAVTVERSVAPETVVPGDTATVTVTVRNDADRTLPDVRIADRPPERLPVVDGSTHGCLSIRPDETERFSYTVRGRRGDHDFDDPIVRLRPLSAGDTSTASKAVDGDSRLQCRQPVATRPVRTAVQQSTGTGTTAAAGRGVAFHSVREYRHGDDASRVDWRGFAKTGDLSTVTFQEPSTTGIAIVVDGRPPGRVTAAEDRPTGVELASYAADQLFEQASTDGHRVSLTALGIRVGDVDTHVESDREGRPWVPLGDDEETKRRIRAVLSAVDAAARDETESRRRRTPIRSASLCERLASDVDTVVVTPALDDGGLELVAELSAKKTSTLVVSPDVTTTSERGDEAGVGPTVARIERLLRLERMAQHGATVVDWHPDRPLAAALEGST